MPEDAQHRPRGESMKIIFFGTPDFARESLKAIHDAHDVVSCVTRPDRPSGRGRKSRPSSIRSLCNKLGIKTLQPENPTELEKMISVIEADIFVAVAYGTILSTTVLNKPSLGCINLHASLLPKYRGAAPVNWAIIRGEKITGVTVIQMVEKMDAGPILGTDETDIADGETAGRLYERLSSIGASLLMRVLTDIQAGTVRETSQDETRVTYAPSLTRQSGLINWNTKSDELNNFVKGMTPRPGAYTSLPAKDLRIIIIQVEPNTAPPAAEASPGRILSVSDNGIETACADGSVFITKLKPAGKREMTAAEFLRGYRLEPGEVWD